MGCVQSTLLEIVGKQLHNVYITWKQLILSHCWLKKFGKNVAQVVISISGVISQLHRLLNLFPWGTVSLTLRWDHKTGDPQSNLFFSITATPTGNLSLVSQGNSLLCVIAVVFVLVWKNAVFRLCTNDTLTTLRTLSHLSLLEDVTVPMTDVTATGHLCDEVITSSVHSHWVRITKEFMYTTAHVL